MVPHIFLYGTPKEFINYERSLTAAGAVVRFGDYTDCDGLLLPGGGDVCPHYYGEQGDYGEEERDKAEFALVEAFLQRKKPILGICRGLQVLNVAFGGNLLQDITGHTKEQGADRLHETTILQRSFLGELYGGCAVVNSAHHQAIKGLGEGLQAVQWAEDGIIEGICHKTLPVFGVQWHPERCRGGMRRVDTAEGQWLMDWFVKQCG